MPNFELLKDAYAIIGGIPERAINLDMIELAKGESLGCGTVCCAAGWLGNHPQFQKLGLYNTGLGTTMRLGGSVVSYQDAMAEIFDISEYEAEDMFCSVCSLKDERSGKSHKQIWLQRVRDYLQQHGQLKSQLAEKVKKCS